MEKRPCFEKWIKGELFQFFPEKVVIRPRISQMIVADLHIGKSTIFRTNGLPISMDAMHKDLHLLSELIEENDIKELLILGDLWHGHHNEEHLLFGAWLEQYSELKCILTTGNHDRYDSKYYEQTKGRIQTLNHIEEHGFSFSHESRTTQLFQFLGHIHPKYSLRGKGALSHTGPCFFLSETDGYCILPAFCSLSGGQFIRKKHKSDEVLLIAGSEILSC